VHYVQSKSGERKFVNDADYTKLIGDAWKPVDGVPNPVDDGKELLTVHSELAQKLGLSKGQFATPEALASSRAWRIIDTFAPNAGEAVIQFLNAGWVRMVLIVLFIITVKISFSAPGHGVAEATALITLGLIVGIPLLTGYAQWWEIALIFVGLSLLAFEIFVFPGHLVSGAIGLLMMIGGLVMTFVPREPSHPGILPQMSGTWISMQRGLLFVTCGMLCSLLLWLWLQRYLPKIPYFNKLVLNTAGGATLQPAVNDRAEPWPAIGTIGRAVSELKPGGNASFPDPATGESRIAHVISDSGFVAPNTQIVVREVAGNRVVVRPA
jgi:membrane-bound serine protease (ClpP class)